MYRAELRGEALLIFFDNEVQAVIPAAHAAELILIISNLDRSGQQRCQDFLHGFVTSTRLVKKIGIAPVEGPADQKRELSDEEKERRKKMN